MTKHILLCAGLLCLFSGCQSGQFSEATAILQPVVTLWGRPYEGRRETEEVEYLQPEAKDETPKSGGAMGTVELAWAEVDDWVRENKVIVIQRKRLDNGNCGLLYWVNP